MKIRTMLILLMAGVPSSVTPLKACAPTKPAHAREVTLSFDGALLQSPCPRLSAQVVVAHPYWGWSDLDGRCLDVTAMPHWPNEGPKGAFLVDTLKNTWIVKTTNKLLIAADEIKSIESEGTHYSQEEQREVVQEGIFPLAGEDEEPTFIAEIIHSYLVTLKDGRSFPYNLSCGQGGLLHLTDEGKKRFGLPLEGSA